MRAERADQTSRETCGEIAKLYPAVIASAAKQSMAQHTRKLDCFASLAMTVLENVSSLFDILNQQQIVDGVSSRHTLRCRRPA